MTGSEIFHTQKSIVFKAGFQTHTSRKISKEGLVISFLQSQRKRTVFNEKFTFPLGRLVGWLEFIVQHGGKKTNTFKDSKKSAYFVNLELKSFPHNSKIFSECYCIGRFRTCINFSIGHVSSYNSCRFHLVCVTLDGQNLGSWIKYDALCIDLFWEFISTILSILRSRDFLLQVAYSNLLPLIIYKANVPYKQ